MKHAANAILLYRLAASLEALLDYCNPGVATILRPFIQPINRIADWHAREAKEASRS
jgi:hypothetical protein